MFDFYYIKNCISLDIINYKLMIIFCKNHKAIFLLRIIIDKIVKKKLMTTDTKIIKGETLNIVIFYNSKCTFQVKVSTYRNRIKR